MNARRCTEVNKGNRRADQFDGDARKIPVGDSPERNSAGGRPWLRGDLDVLPRAPALVLVLRGRSHGRARGLRVEMNHLESAKEDPVENTKIDNHHLHGHRGGPVYYV